MKLNEIVLKESMSASYRVPSDPEKKLYDFYLLTLYNRLIEQGVENPRHGMSPETVQDLEAFVKEATPTIVNFMKEDILNAFLFSIVSEMRHLVNQPMAGQESYKMAIKSGLSPQYQKFFHRRDGEKPTEKKGTQPEYDDAYLDFIKSGWDEKSFIEFSREALVLPGWTPGYGGDKWALACEAWLKLHAASTLKEKQIWIDYCISVEHNNDIILDKVRRYKKYMNHKWIKVALEAKHHLTPKELAFGSSIKSVAAKLNRMLGVDKAMDKKELVDGGIKAATARIALRSLSPEWKRHIGGLPTFKELEEEAMQAMQDALERGKATREEKQKMAQIPSVAYRWAKETKKRFKAGEASIFSSKYEPEYRKFFDLEEKPNTTRVSGLRDYSMENIDEYKKKEDIPSEVIEAAKHDQWLAHKLVSAIKAPIPELEPTIYGSIYRHNYEQRALGGQPMKKPKFTF